MIVIYTLVCPRTDAIRYVGMTSKSLAGRLASYLGEARRGLSGHRVAWIRSLLRAGLKPIIRHDLDVSAGADWREVERSRIAHYRAMGCALTNATDGGEGLQNPSTEVRQRMSNSARYRKYSEDGLARSIASAKEIGRANAGRRKSEEERARMSATRTGRSHTEETRAKMRIAQSARAVRPAHTPEARAKMSASRKGKTLSAEHRANIAAGGRRRYAKLQSLEDTP